MDNISVITAINSLAATIIAFVAFYFAHENHRAKMISDIFPQSRIKWISDVREAIFKFIDTYFEEENLKPVERKKLHQAILKIELFLNYSYGNKDYCNLKEILYNYLNANEIITNHLPLIIATQEMFDSVLARAKAEAGISPDEDKKIRDMFQLNGKKGK